jgi:predicted hotdog family 3-hydroxylacyl-ACP dehydratase
VSSRDLEELVPHRAPMLLLDELVSSGDECTVCSVTPRADSVFAENGRVPSWVALEYCAQCVAVFAGLRARDAGEAPRLGMLVAARDLALETEWFDPGEVLHVSARLVFGDSRMGRFECEVTRGRSTVAKASLSVYQAEHRDVVVDAD